MGILRGQMLLELGFAPYFRKTKILREIACDSIAIPKKAQLNTHNRMLPNDLIMI